MNLVKRNNVPKILTANELSEAGLIYKINKEVLHPLGLALAISKENNSILGCVVSKDKFIIYNDELIQRNELKLKDLKKNLREFKKEIKDNW